MDIKERLKNLVKELDKEKKQIEVELTKLHIQRNKGQNINPIFIKILYEELDIIKRRLKDMKRVSK